MDDPLEKVLLESELLAVWMPWSPEIPEGSVIARALHFLPFSLLAPPWVKLMDLRLPKVLREN